MRLRTVILRHEQPDGSAHFDWMLAVDDPATKRLRTWRVALRPDEVPPGEDLAVEPLADHRATYLDYEGPVAGDRGLVRRVRSGWWTPAAEVEPAAEHLLLSVHWDGDPAPQQWSIRHQQAHRLS
ncbi:MAG: hypothetical protein IT430_15445 [Phycisphaerales bacterium]|nr:hypothetical protein [Phycisphaerales bacterium]